MQIGLGRSAYDKFFYPDILRHTSFVTIAASEKQRGDQKCQSLTEEKDCGIHQPGAEVLARFVNLLELNFFIPTIWQTGQKQRYVKNAPKKLFENGG
ncbi:MAG: hypothetical protein ACO1OT_08710 [Heyndrickxia sp.]